MALHDTDKDTADRSSPTPNTDDVLGQRMAHGTTQVQHNSEGSDIDQRLQFDERRMLGVNNGIPTALFGFDTMSRQFVIRTTPEGVDVTTASDDEFTFNSAQNTFKIVGTGVYSFTLPSAAPSTATFQSYTLTAHGLASTPLLIGSFLNTGPTFTNQTFPLPFTFCGNSVALGALWGIEFMIQLAADSTNVYADIFYSTDGAGNPLFSSTGQLRYYILQETAAVS